MIVLSDHDAVRVLRKLRRLERLEEELEAHYLEFEADETETRAFTDFLVKVAEAGKGKEF